MSTEMTYRSTPGSAILSLLTSSKTMSASSHTPKRTFTHLQFTVILQYIQCTSARYCPSLQSQPLPSDPKSKSKRSHFHTHLHFPFHRPTKESQNTPTPKLQFFFLSLQSTTPTPTHTTSKFPLPAPSHSARLATWRAFAHSPSRVQPCTHSAAS